MFDPKDWHLKDPFPDQPLDKITPISLRSWCVLVRSKEKIVFKEGFLNLVGAIDMMRGLDYHHERFCTIVSEIAKLPFLDVQCEQKKLYLVHEAVAYINRLGQFYHFASSDFVKTRVSDWDKIIPTIIDYKKFRDKHSAHRSLDKPRKEDSSHLQQVHAWAISSISGNLFSPKPGKVAPMTLEYIFSGKRWTDSYLNFQLIGNSVTDTHNLSIEREHPLFINEAYKLISSLLSLP